MIKLFRDLAIVFYVVLATVWIVFAVYTCSSVADAAWYPQMAHSVTNVKITNNSSYLIGYVRFNEDRTDFTAYPEKDNVYPHTAVWRNLQEGMHGFTVYDPTYPGGKIMDYFEIKIYGRMMEINYGL